MKLEIGVSKSIINKRDFFVVINKEYYIKVKKDQYWKLREYLDKKASEKNNG